MTREEKQTYQCCIDCVAKIPRNKRNGGTDYPKRYPFAATELGMVLPDNEVEMWLRELVDLGVLLIDEVFEKELTDYVLATSAEILKHKSRNRSSGEF